MLTPRLHWVLPETPHRLAVTPCPAGFEQLSRHVEIWRRSSIECVVSLLEPHEAKSLGVEREQTCCEDAGLRFISFPIPDHGLPRIDSEFESLIGRVAAEVAGGTAMAIHCYAGIGRTGMLAACILHKLGIPGAEIFDRLKEARGHEMPETPEQRTWVENFIRKAGGAL